MKIGSFLFKGVVTSLQKQTLVLLIGKQKEAISLVVRQPLFLD